MKIDIFCIIYKNYYLLDRQIEHWQNHMRGDFNLIFLDNTPPYLYQKREGITYIGDQTNHSFDGLSSGQAYDIAIRMTSSPLIGMVDPDMFWLNPDILDTVEADYKDGYKCIGCAGFYDHFQSIFDVANPQHRGELAPCLWGMFIDRELALSETWACEPPGIGKITGWRVREKIIDQNIKRETIPGFFIEGDTFFGWDQDKPLGVHFLKGCSTRMNVMPEIVPKVLARELPKWT